MRRLAFVLSLVPLACGGEEDAPAGEERGPCYPNGTCNEGLVCASDICVDLSESSDTEATGESDTKTSPTDPAEGETQSGEEGEAGTTADPGGCADHLLSCMDAPDVECLYGYIQCVEEEGGDGCSAFYDGCDLVAWEFPGCSEADAVFDQYCGGDTTTGASDTSASDGDATNGSGGGADAECISRGQCAAACSNHIWACDACGSDYIACPNTSTLEGCTQACEIGFDTNNDIAIEFHSCSLLLGQVCDESAFADCFYGLYC